MVINTMHRLALVAVAAAVLLSPASVEATGAERARLHAEALRSMYPRPESSAGDAALRAYLEAALDRLAVSYRVLGFDAFTEGHSFSSAVEVVIPGTDDDSGTLIVAVPLNHPEHAEPDDDRSASVAAALAVLETAANASRRVTLRFVFLGAEYGESGNGPLGTARFLSGYFPDNPHALVYLDVSHDRFTLDTGGGGAVAPAWLVTRTVDAFTGVGATVRVRAHLNQLHRLAISTAPPPLSAFLAAGIPAVYVTGESAGFAPPSVTATAVRLAGVLDELLLQFEDGIPRTWDHHYLYFRLGTRQIVIGEQLYLLLLLGVILATILYAVLFRHRLGRYLTAIGRNLWNLPVLLLLAFGFLTAGTALLRLLLIVRRFPTLWQHSPLAYSALKMSIALLCFTVAVQLLRRLPFARNGSFYSASALLILFVDVILFSVIDLSLGYYFVWAYACAFLFSVARSRTAKALFLALAPVFLILVGAEVLRGPELRLTEFILLTFEGSLLLSFVTLPFLLMFIRLDFLIRHPVRGRRSFALRTASFTFGLATIGFAAFVLVSTPYSNLNPQPVHAIERIDYRELVRSFSLTSDAPLQTLEVRFAGQGYRVETGDRSWSIESPILPDVLRLRLTYEGFLDRERAELLIDAPLPLDTVSVSFSSREPMVLYDVNYPYTLNAEQTGATISIGRRPPMPLVVAFTVAQGTAPSVVVTATSTSHPDPFEVSGRPIDLTSRLEIVSGFGR